MNLVRNSRVARSLRAPSLRDCGPQLVDIVPALKRGANNPCASGAVAGVMRDSRPQAYSSESAPTTKFRAREVLFEMDCSSVRTSSSRKFHLFVDGFVAELQYAFYVSFPGSDDRFQPSAMARFR